jgi:hypothetical protein
MICQWHNTIFQATVMAFVHIPSNNTRKFNVSEIRTLAGPKSQLVQHPQGSSNRFLHTTKKYTFKSNKPALTSASYYFITFKRTNKETEVISGPNAKVCELLRQNSKSPD